jgi:hypothetical protein
MRRYCAQLVYNLRTVSLRLVGLHTVSADGSNGTVDLSSTYTSSKPVFVLGLVHRFFAHLTEVTVRLMPTIHTTNKDKYKYKLRIST